MSSAPWTLLPRQGIRRDDLELRFGDARPVLRARLARELCALPPGAFPDEDDFESLEGDEFLRLRFADDRLVTIEMQKGSLRYHDIELLHGATRSQLEQQLATRNHTLEPSTWLDQGHDCKPLGLTLATEEAGGGDSEESIEYIVIAPEPGKR